MTDHDDEREAGNVELPLERFDRLLRALEMLVQNEQRKLAQQNDNERRAARKAGPTTPEAEARVERKLKKWAGG